MMLPILISVSVAPVSYFFCADASLLINAAIAKAAEKAADRRWIAGIWTSLVWLNVSIFLIGSAFWLLGRIEYPVWVASKKKPPATGSQGALFSRTERDHGPVKGRPQLLSSPEMVSPNNSHFSPLNRIICNWSIGAKSVGEVLILMPGSKVSGVKSFRLAACFITLARVRSSPHISMTLAMVCAAQTMAKVIEMCGDDLTRANVMKQAASLKDFTPDTLLPGIKINTSPTDFAPIDQLQMMRFKGEKWELFGDTISGELNN